MSNGRNGSGRSSRGTNGSGGNVGDPQIVGITNLPVRGRAGTRREISSGQYSHLCRNEFVKTDASAFC